jgi:hypothetical protein
VHRAYQPRRHSATPAWIVPLAIVVVVIILLRSPGALILLAVIIPAWFWLAIGVVIAVLVIVALREHLAGRDF